MPLSSIRICSFVALVFCTPFSVGLCQSTDAPVGTQHQQVIVDGSKHPDQLPDALAYRLYFLATAESPSATQAERGRQVAKLNAARLSSADIAKASQILADFHVRNEQWQKRYEQAVKDSLTFGTEVDNASFMRDRESIVADTHTAMQTSLTEDGVRNLEALIQHEKRYMVAVLDSSDTGNGDQAK